MTNKLTINEVCVTIKTDMDIEEQKLLDTLQPLVPATQFNRKLTEFKVSSNYIQEVLQVYRGITKDNVGKLPPLIRELWDLQSFKGEATKYIMQQDFVGKEDFLMPHQRRAVALANVHDRYGFYYDTRTGKTPLSLQIINNDIKLNPDHKWLIICPLILINNAWLIDAEKFFPELQMQSLHAATKAKRLEAFKRNANVYLINCESFEKYIEEIDKLGIYGAFVDESSKMKSHSSKFSKAAVAFSFKMKRWYLLSGTPAPNCEAEYYMQLRSLDPYCVPASYTQFELKYFNNLSYNPQYKVLSLKQEKADDLKKLIARYAVYVDKADVLNLPGREFIDCDIPMPDNLMKEYKLMKNKLYLELVKGTENLEDMIMVESEVAKVNKLRQISSGFIYNEDGQATLLDMYKFNYLLELLNKLGDEQVLIFANYRYEFEVIKELLGSKCLIINGTVLAQEKDNAVQAFMNKSIQYLVVNPASLSMGVTLTNAHLCIYFSMDYSYERFYQSRDRIYADKSKQPYKCMYYFIQTEGTVDMLIREVVEGKGVVSTALLNYLKGGN